MSRRIRVLLLRLRRRGCGGVGEGGGGGPVVCIPMLGGEIVLGRRGRIRVSGRLSGDCQ